MIKIMRYYLTIILLSFIFTSSFVAKADTIRNNNELIAFESTSHAAVSYEEDSNYLHNSSADDFSVADNPDNTRTVYVNNRNILSLSAVPKYKVTNLKCDLPTSVTDDYPDPLDGQPDRVHVMQCFVSDNNYAYVTQQHGNGVTTISRCLFNSNKTIATYQDRMIITNAGHGTTLERYTCQGNDYFLMGLNVAANDDNHYSLQIGRVPYTPSENAVNFNSFKRFINLNYANTEGSSDSFGDIKSVKAAISPNESTICFAVKNICNQIRYSYYDFTELKMYLQYGNMTTSFKNNTILQGFGKSTLTPNTAVIPAANQQGMDIYNDTNGTVSYTTIGVQNKGLNGAYIAPKLMFFDSSDGTVIKTENVNTTYTEFGNPEMEGVHVHSYGTVNVGAVAFDKVNNNNKIAFIYNISVEPE
jgi:hypothetical protein